MKKSFFGLSILIFCFMFSNKAQADDSAFRLKSPDLKWEISFNQDNFVLLNKEFTIDQSSSFFAFNQKNNFDISAFIESKEVLQKESSAKGDGAIACRDFYTNRLKAWRKTYKYLDTLGLTLFYYDMDKNDDPQFNDMKQRHINAYFEKDGYWIDVHISEIPFIESDFAEMLKTLQKIKFQKASENDYKRTFALKFGNDRFKFFYPVNKNNEDKIKVDDSTGMTTITVFSVDNKYNLQMTCLPYTEETKTYFSEEALKLMVLQMAGGVGEMSGTKPELKTIKENGYLNEYFSATDKNSKVGEYAEMTSGAILIDNCVILYTALSKSKDNTLYTNVSNYLKEIKCNKE